MIRMIIPTESGLKAVRYAFDETLGDFIRVEQPFVDFLSGEPMNEEDRQIIFSHPALRSVQFLFGYLNTEEEREPLWKDQWQRNRLPFAVRLRLGVAENKSLSSFERTIFVPHGDWGDL